MKLPELEQLNHAILITGNRARNLIIVKKYLEEQGIAIQSNPDLIIFNEEQLLRESVDHIVASVAMRRVSHQRFCIISFDRINSTEQNVLLKTLEEPQQGTYFFILVPDTERILPTILSRCQTLVGINAIGESRLSANEFLSQTLSGRFADIEKLTRSKKDEENLTKSEVISFIDGLEQELWNRDFRKESVFTDLRKMRSYANVRGASHRIILDFLAMVCPLC